MKKSLWLSILIVVTAPCAFATDPFSTAPAPAQSFHTVQSNAAALPPAPTVNAPAPTVSSAALDSGAAIIHSEPAQSTNENDATRIQNLIVNNQAMISAIRALNQNVTVLQQQVMELESTHPASASNWLIQTLQNPDVIGFLSFGGVAILLLVLGVMISRRVMRKAESIAMLSQKRVHADVLDDDTKSEYDFMSSNEAIPAKLDLARAYIAMNDAEQARTVLTTVIEKGNQEQRTEALSLLQSVLKR